MNELYDNPQFDLRALQKGSNGKITERDKFNAAKQILFGLAVLYVITLFAYVYKPDDCEKLIDICTTTFPPLATLILVAYFRDKSR